MVKPGLFTLNLRPTLNKGARPARRRFRFDNSSSVIDTNHMDDNVWHKIDAHLFRLLGLALGVFGVTALIRNNPQEILFSDYYGISLIIIFALTGAYSLFSIVTEVFPGGQGGKKN